MAKIDAFRAVQQVAAHCAMWSLRDRAVLLLEIRTLQSPMQIQA
jgi:hypothetical protein